MKKLRVEEVIVVEGKYDAVKLADLVDGLILTTNGFSVFKNAETKRLLVELGKKRGIIVLTDSDDAGFRIRNYVNKLAQGICVKNAYVPAIAGKERRKAQPSKEGVAGRGGCAVRSDTARTADRGRAGKGEARRARHHLYRPVRAGPFRHRGKRGRAARLAAKPWPAAAPFQKSAVRGAQQSVHL